MIVNEYSKDGNVLTRMMEESGHSFCTLEYYENFKEDMWFSDFNVSEKFRSSYRDWETDRKSTRLNSSPSGESRMPSSA